MVGDRWAAWCRFALLGVCAAGLSGCAWLFGDPQSVTAGREPGKQNVSVTYGDGVAIVRLVPQTETPPASAGKLIARVKLKPALFVKPGDERLAAAAPAPAIAAPATGALDPGWSIENHGRPPSGLTVNGVRLDPGGTIDPTLLRQAIARAGREGDIEKIPSIAVVDFSLPADRPRWFFVNLKTGAVTAKYVSHGHAKRLCRMGGCGPNYRGGFSLNTPAVSADANTDATSLGLYRVIGERPEGGKFAGPTIALAGLDPSNASAQARGIIIHQNPRYFDPKRGLFGRSQGCFVFAPEDLRTVVTTLAPGSLIFAGMAPQSTASLKLRQSVN